jgi:enoyl-CoA hydratase
VNEVYPQEELLTKTKELATAIAKNSPQGIEKAIKAVNLSDTESGFDAEIQFFGQLFEMNDKQEGVKAFLEKRKPEF